MDVATKARENKGTVRSSTGPAALAAARARSSLFLNPKGQKTHKHNWTPQSKWGAPQRKDGKHGQISQVLHLIYLSSTNFPAWDFSSRPSCLSCLTQVLHNFIDLCDIALIHLFSSIQVLADFLSPCKQS